jgi:hypothetical protein
MDRRADDGAVASGDNGFPWDEDDLCAVCPGQVHDPGRFDIAERPDASRYDTVKGYRRDIATGVPVCMHPEKIGFPPGRYASAGERWPGDLEPGPHPGELPDDPAALAEWMAALVRHAGPDGLASTLMEAEAAASAKFPAEVVVTALREALAAG